MTDPIVQQIRSQLEAPLQGVIDATELRGEPISQVFFLNLQRLLREASSEIDLIGFSMELATCAFVGLDYGPESAIEIDGFLEMAESISHAMSADPGSAH